MKPLLLFYVLLAYARASKRSLSEGRGVVSRTAPERSPSTGVLARPGHSDLSLKRALTKVVLDLDPDI